MMMKDDKKKVATIIVSKMKGNEEKLREAPESEGAEMEDSDELTMIADEVMQAIKNGDVRALKESLESMIQVAVNKESEPEESEEDYEESED